jgi:hypothetical protein
MPTAMPTSGAKRLMAINTRATTTLTTALRSTSTRIWHPTPEYPSRHLCATALT